MSALEFEFDFLLFGLLVLLTVSVVYEFVFKRRSQKASGGTGKSATASALRSATSSTLLWLLLAAVIGRMAMWFIPSVEPVIPLAVFAGLAAGPVYGALIGAVGYFGSNLFMPFGMTGMWWAWQSLGGLVAGLLAGVLVTGRKPTGTDLVLFTFFGTIAFELIVSVGGGLQFNPAYLFSSLPFIAMHVITNIIMALFLTGFLKGATEGPPKEAAEEKKE